MAGVAQKKISDYIPPLKTEGVPFVAGAASGGISFQTKKITLGGSPHTVTFASLGMKDMEDSSYLVLVGGETVALTKVDESTITTAGFDILGGGATEVAHVLVVGRLKGQGY